MKTLVIHPDDPSTGFLEEIYLNKGYCVTNAEISKSALKRLIFEHDKIIILGHGTEEGLLSKEQDRLVIDSSYVYLLREKYNIGIWCNADVFFKKYGLRGLFSGMIISEHSEAEALSVKTTALELTKSNLDLSRALNFVEKINNKYSLLIFRNIYKGDETVIKFNRERVYYT